MVTMYADSLGVYRFSKTFLQLFGGNFRSRGQLRNVLPLRFCFLRKLRLQSLNFCFFFFKGLLSSPGLSG